MPPPALTGGFLSIGLWRSFQGEHFDVQGAFTDAAVQIDDFELQRLQGFPQLSDGECAMYDDLDAETASGVGTVDAGSELLLAGPNGSITIPSQVYQGNIVYTARGDSSLFSPGSPYTISGAGGQIIDGFEEDLVASGDFLVTYPDLFRGYLNVTKGVDLEIEWSNPGDGYVFVMMDNHQVETGDFITVLCKFADDGRGRRTRAHDGPLLRA